MKAERKEEKKFIPIILTIETQEEFDFLRGLFMADADVPKVDCAFFNPDLDVAFSDLLYSMRR